MLAKQAYCACGALPGRGRRLDAPWISARRKKVLIGFVRNRLYGALIQGLKNLESFPRGNGIILFACTKRTKSTPEGCDPLDSGDGSKLYGLCFSVTLPTLVPKPVCGATRFFGCFEPVRKGSCSADARPLLFENGMLYSKLTGANVF